MGYHRFGGPAQDNSMRYANKGGNKSCGKKQKTRGITSKKRETQLLKRTPKKAKIRRESGRVPHGSAGESVRGDEKKEPKPRQERENERWVSGGTTKSVV